jgi:fibronectin type 3 domain-containing protein
MTALNKFRNFFAAIAGGAIVGIFAAHAFAAQATLAWDPNTETDLAGYRIHYGTASGSYTVHLDVHNVTTYTVTGLADGQTYYFAATAYNASGSESGYSNQVTFSASSANSPPSTPSTPTGPSSASVNSTVTFSTSASDSNNDTLTYRYDWGGGNVGNWGTASQSHTWSAAGHYTVKAQARDSKGAESAWSGGKTVTLSTSSPNQPPTASAGADQTVNSGVAVTLRGSGSDPEHTIAAYRWRQASGTAVTLSSNTSAQAGFTAPTLATGSTALVFELQVTDAAGSTGTDTVSITVQSADIDGDGVPNSQDAFPTNRAEWKDSDGDGLGDNSDPEDDRDETLDAAEEEGARHSIGVFRPGTGEWLLDLNGNRKWDGTSTDGVIKFGKSGDLPVTGDWNHDGVAEIGVFRPGTGEWLLDLNGNDRLDAKGVDAYLYFGSKGDQPVTGVWKKGGAVRIGVFRPSTGEWLLDLNGNRKWDGSRRDGLFRFGKSGDLPVTGDWNNDGVADIGVFRPSTGEWLLDLNGNRKWDGSRRDGLYRFGKSGDLPVTGDWNHDGVAEIGVFRPGTGEWLLDLNGNDKWDGSGVDGLYRFGSGGDRPVAGEW